MSRSNYLLLILVLFFVKCSSEEPQVGNSIGSQNSNSWLIPESAILDGGPGKDGIPSVDDPLFISASEADYLQDNDLVIGYKYDTTIRAYPHQILDWHEIVNDKVENHRFAITYCPLTGTAINWSRNLAGVSTTFGVSGLLFNSNLMPYDRETNSTWSQMRLDCVNGFLAGNEAPTFSIIETTWKTWRTLYPETKVLSRETGFSRNYGSYPYFTSNGDYRNEDYLIFPVLPDDPRLGRKERVLGVLNGGNATAYRFTNFADTVDVVNDRVGGDNIAVIGSRPDNFMVAYKVEDQVLSIDAGIISDQNGNVYDLFGYVTSGPDSLARLEPVTSFIGYWFSWGAFYPQINIYEAPSE